MAGSPAAPRRPLVAIPARLASTRLPGKPLADIHGEAMIVQVWRRAVEADLGPVVVACGEPEIAAAIHHAYWQEQQIVEGAGAVGIAALMAARIPAAGATVIVTSGGNIDMGLHHRVVSGEPVDLSAAHA